MSRKGRLGEQGWLVSLIRLPIPFTVIIGFLFIAGCSAATPSPSPALTPSAAQPLGIETQPAMTVEPTLTQKPSATTPAPQGNVRVIVLLAVPFTPEGYLSSTDVAIQRSAIAQARAGLLSSLAGHEVTVVSQSEFTPTIVLLVDQAALKILQSSPLVAQVQVDTALPPAKP